MAAPRSRQEAKRYKQYLKTRPAGCIFCEFKKHDNNFVSQTRSFRVIKNKFPYSVWDGQKVADHLMIIPKRHTESLDKFTPAQAAEFLELINSYELKGYNFYARAPESSIKTVPHQHTHLIKTVGAPHKFMMLLRAPFYFRIPR